MKNRFIEKSLIKALYFLKDTVFSEEYSKAGGLMQNIDPRIKLISLTLVLLVISLLKSIQLILFLYLLSILLAYLSKINLVYFMRRVWIFIPLFSLFIAIPACFEIFTPGERILWIITRQGISGAMLFVFRVLTSLSFSILLVLTTSSTSLLRALRSLGIAQIFVVTFMMCYRYIYIFINTIEDTYMGIKSRIIANLKNRKTHGIIAWRISILWEKSRAMSEEVYLAMLSRGYAGEPKANYAFKLKAIDLAWILFVIAIYLAILYFDGRKSL